MIFTLFLFLVLVSLEYSVASYSCQYNWIVFRDKRWQQIINIRNVSRHACCIQTNLSYITCPVGEDVLVLINHEHLTVLFLLILMSVMIVRDLMEI